MIERDYHKKFIFYVCLEEEFSQIIAIFMIIPLLIDFLLSQLQLLFF